MVSSRRFLPAEAIPSEPVTAMKYNLAVGGSGIVNPAGLFVRKPVFQQETLVWADNDPRERRLAQAHFDSLGQYGRFHFRSLTIREEAGRPAGPKPLGRPAAQRELGHRLAEVADRFEVDLRQLGALLECLVSGEGT